MPRPSLKLRAKNFAALSLEHLEDRTLPSAIPLSNLSSTANPPGIIAQTPYDPQFPAQWDLQNTGQNGGQAGADVRATQAWDATTGSTRVTVGVLDTGIDYNNPDLYLNIWVNQAEIPDQWLAGAGLTRVVRKADIKDFDGDGLTTFRDLNAPINAGLVNDNNGDGRIDAGDLLRPVAQGGWENGSTKDGALQHPDDFFGWNFVNNTNDPFDDNGHGTHLAGTIGATG